MIKKKLYQIFENESKSHTNDEGNDSVYQVHFDVPIHYNNKRSPFRLSDKDI